MKQYTTPEQTAKLIELWLPKNINGLKVFSTDYSIGELIEMLPSRFNNEDLEIHRDWAFERWLVFYRGDDAEVATELLDALYNMICKLKNENRL